MQLIIIFDRLWRQVYASVHLTHEAGARSPFLRPMSQVRRWVLFCDRVNEHGVLRLKPILWIGDR